jgi:hypothetical protein
MSFFQDDNRGRNFLTSNAVSFTYDESVSWSRLSENWSRHNQGRPLNQQRVESAVLAYAERMEEGSKAPAVICRELANGELEVLDGCHRLMAAEMNNATSFAAFIVRCKDDTAKKIRIWANTAINGEAVVDPEWSIKTLIQEFIIEGSDTVESIAQWVGRPVSDIKSRVNAIKNRSIVENLLREHGGFKPGELRQGQCDLFVQIFGEYIEGAPKECAKILRMPQDYKLTNGDTEELFNALKPTKFKKSVNPSVSLKSKIREVQQSEDWISRMDITKRNSPQVKVNKALRSLKTVVVEMKKHKASWHINDAKLLAEHHQTMIDIAKIIRELCDAELKTALDKKLGTDAFVFEFAHAR